MMTPAQSVDTATDSQLRQLAKPWRFESEYTDLLTSAMPLLTMERSRLINLLKANSVFHFATTTQ